MAAWSAAMSVLVVRMSAAWAAFHVTRLELRAALWVVTASFMAWRARPRVESMLPPSRPPKGELLTACLMVARAVERAAAKALLAVAMPAWNAARSVWSWTLSAATWATASRTAWLGVAAKRTRDSRAWIMGRIRVSPFLYDRGGIGEYAA